MNTKINLQLTFWIFDFNRRAINYLGVMQIYVGQDIRMWMSSICFNPTW